MNHLIVRGVAFALMGLALFWGLTRPERVSPEAMADLVGDAARGEQVFYAGGCDSCHAAPMASGAARQVLSGGQRFASPFGTFLAPNISSDAQAGIGDWTQLDLASAMRFGTAPDGSHYYPAFPYTSYANVSLQDISDLHAYLATLPASKIPSQPHEVGFPFNIRRGLGLWKRLYAGKGWVLDGDLSPQLIRGRYLVEGLGHCSECHTARGVFGGLDRSAWMGGGPNPSSKEKIPNLTSAVLKWSERDIEFYLETGFTPEYDSAGAQMASVVLGTAKLTKDDRAAIAAYFKAIAPVE